MKIEKINDNQIRCTLTREDLEDRNIKLSELAYGSEKAKSLFRDMVQRANYEVGFEADDIPLMVEAIPLSSESIILQITKVEYPEEIDTRFSNFTEADEEDYADIDSAKSEAEPLPTKGADDILDFFKEVRKEFEKKISEDKQEKTAEAPTVVKDLTKLFELGSLDQVCRLAHVMAGYYDGRNDLYKDEKTNKYYLVVHKSDHTPAEFNKICNRISEYAAQRNYTPAKGAYLNEHGKLIVKQNALEVLASL